MTTASSNLKAISLPDSLLLLTILLWGINFSVVKVALVEIPPLLFTGLRLIIALTVILTWIKAAGHVLKFERRHLLQLVILSILANTCYQLFFVYGINNTTADNTALIVSTMPVWIAVLGTLAGMERLAARGWFGVTLSLVGIVLIILGSDRQAELSFGGATLWGDFLVLLAVLSWALYSLALRPMTRHYSSEALTGFSMLVGSIPVILFVMPAMAEFGWGQVSTGAWLALVFSGVFSIALPYFFWNYAVSRLGSARTSLYMNLVPPVALGVAWFWLGETLTLQQVWGGLLALGGVIIARRHTHSIS